jgi:predicted Zn-dependent protease
MLRKVGAPAMGQLAEVARQLVTVGYTKYQEVEADAGGVRLSIEAGYDPEAGAVIFNRLKERLGGPTRPRPRTPVGELTRAMEEAMGSYFTSHPASEERARRLADLVFENRRRLSGRTFYVGVENYRQRIPRTQQEFPTERRHL